MTIITEFNRIVCSHKDQISLKSDYEGTMTYEQLDLYANHIAIRLKKELKSNDKVVGVCIERSFKMIATLLGVMKAGLAYIPIDPTYPKDRINYCLRKSCVEIILCNQESFEILAEQYHKVLIDDYSKMESIVDCELNCTNETSLAYIQYTSGSTGNPRGVMITHEAIMNTLMWRIDYYHLNSDDTVIQIPSYAFASSVEDIYSTLLSGGTLVLIKAKDLMNLSYLSHLIVKFSVTHFIMVPSLYQEFLPYLKRSNQTLRFITIAGEQFDKTLVERHYGLLSHVDLYNEYGMTETSVGCVVNKVEPDDVMNVIGTIILNMSSRIMNPDEDDIGELYISGIGLAKGYHNDEKASLEKFVSIDNIRYFITGDYVRKDSAGRLIHMGRKDKQIKVNGQRVNLNEIDNELNKLPAIRNAISLIIEINRSKKILTCIATEDMDYDYKVYLGSKLPKYYIPDFIQVLDEFEYLPNGKVNSKKMGEDFMESLNNEILRNNETVIKLINIANEVADNLIPEFKLSDDINLIGLSSIQVIKFIAKVEESFGFEFGYNDLDEMKPVTIISLYNYIKELAGK